MRALSIRQPWAWLIVNGRKDIENRDWPTNYRGTFFVHAGKTMTESDYADALVTAKCIDPGIWLPDPEDLHFGGFVGTATLKDCVQHSRSDWFAGRYGFVLTDCIRIPFVPYRGMLGFFRVPSHVCAEILSMR